MNTLINSIQTVQSNSLPAKSVYNNSTSKTFLDMATELSDSYTAKAETVNLQEMLTQEYPNLVYHVFDASSSYWQTRNDYPHYLLYQSGDKAAETLENWQPTGSNPFYGSVDGRFIASKEILALSKVPPGSKAVVIHPAVQERMEQNPEYAYEIMAKIDTWFTFDAARNEAILPGTSLGISQAVAIGEDGNIVNAVSSSQPRFSFSQGSDEMIQAYYLRMAKRAEFMEYLHKEQLENSIWLANLQKTANSRLQILDLLQNKDLQQVFGDIIAGMPTEAVLALTQEQIFGTK